MSKSQQISVLVNGKLYPSMHTAAKKLKISFGSLQRRLIATEDNRIRQYINKPIKTNPLPVKIKGIKYPSIKEAARRLKIKPHQVYKLIDD